jgi:hypothetical protein
LDDTVNAQKELVVAELGGSTVPTEEIHSRPGRVQSDGVHPTALGSNEIGAAIAAAMLTVE